MPAHPVTGTGAPVAPDDESDAAYLQFWNERARRGHALDAIRGHLEEQPSPGAARARARRWCNDITNLAEVVIKAMNNTERPE